MFEGFMMDRALQDVLKVHCFGCGALNEHGLQIKSYRIGGDMVCRWRPEPFHIGHPGYVYGGTIASIVDCHAIWTAMAEYCRDVGHDIEKGPPPFAFVTGKLSISYLKPVAIDGEMELRARVTDKGERKTVVACQVFQEGVECASAEVVTVRVKTMG
ncbi:PaaI family thioesterase [Polaromonas sp. SM01]|uniref:PaaI family thioesterase n=1 Tax=Polaromonas sp. SM01 TaxID=3085630 RepID=UPI002981A8F0|nr:PaaI family thioesterase [Polaromonas sp. SM01]MDW5441790.1 PaaI family thioesterase [Polaromonas sp. SM01]